VYGAGFDRDTLTHVQNNKDLKVLGTRYLKADTYLLIDGMRVWGGNERRQPGARQSPKTF
jgi:hypothetical protein